MANQADKVDTHNQSGSEKSTPPRPAEGSEEAALELRDIRVTKPPQVPEEEMGSDPYNHTGRFSRDD